MKRMTNAILRILPGLTILICLGLAGWIWLPFNGPPSQQIAAPAPNPTQAATPIAETLETGAQQLTERPLFHMTRRPPAPAEEAAPAAPVEVTLSLTGVLDSDDVQIALLRLSNSPELLRRRVGEEIGDWLIVDITKTSITVIAKNGESQIIALSPSSP